LSDKKRSQEEERKGRKFCRFFTLCNLGKLTIAGSLTVGSDWNFDTRFATYDSSLWPFGSPTECLKFEILVPHNSSVLGIFLTLFFN